MSSKLLLAVAMVATMALGQVSFAAECAKDEDCTGGTVCIMATSPHECKAPQAAGAACKRDAVCASKKCDIPAGADAGKCT
jgi:hypothetical protein